MSPFSVPVFKQHFKHATTSPINMKEGEPVFPTKFIIAAFLLNALVVSSVSIAQNKKEKEQEIRREFLTKLAVVARDGNSDSPESALVEAVLKPSGDSLFNRLCGSHGDPDDPDSSKSCVAHMLADKQLKPIMSMGSRAIPLLIQRVHDCRWIEWHVMQPSSSRIPGPRVRCGELACFLLEGIMRGGDLLHAPAPYLAPGPKLRSTDIVNSYRLSCLSNIYAISELADEWRYWYRKCYPDVKRQGECESFPVGNWLNKSLKTDINWFLPSISEE